MNAGSVFSEIFSSETQVDTQKNLSFCLLFLFILTAIPPLIYSALKMYHLSLINQKEENRSGYFRENICGGWIFDKSDES